MTPEAVGNNGSASEERAAPRSRLASVPSSHLVLLIVVVLLGSVLVRQSNPTVVGDGGEYVALAWQFSRGQPPAMTEADMRRYDDHISSQPEQSYFEFGTPRCCVVRDPRFLAGGRYDLAHFWLYPLFAAPFELVTRSVGLADTYAFFGLHLLLLSGLAMVLARRAGAWAAALIVLSPMLWWLDKPHTEIFVFTGIALALCWREDRPEVGALALACAASQNLALAPLLPLYVAAVAVTRGRRWLLATRTIAAIGAATLLVVMHPAYYLARIGMLDPQSALGDQAFRLPGPTKLLTPVIDPYLGLLTWWPALFATAVLATVIAVHRRREERRRWEWRAVAPPVVFGLMVFVELFGAAQNLNSNHGATFAMSRYATWVAPFAIPLLIWFRRSSQAVERSILAVVSCASIVFSLVVAHPVRRDVPGIFRPSYASTLLFQNAPSWYDPLPEVFIEREAAVATDKKFGAPAAAAGCSKVLVYMGVWPQQCPTPEDVPASCTESRFCYASRLADGGYEYTTVEELT